MNSRRCAGIEPRRANPYNPTPMKLQNPPRLMILGVLGFVLFGCQTVPTNAPTPHQVSVERTRKSVAYLASDALEGRGVGTKGIDLAADYLADEVKSIGLKPAKGADGYFQHFSVRGDASVDLATTVSLAGATIELNKDYRPHAISKAAAFTGPVTFVGYAINQTEPAYNDFEGVDLKGRVALAMRFEPHNEKGKSRLASTFESWSDAASLTTKAEAAAKAGATALLVVNPPNHHNEADELSAFGRRSSRNLASIPVIQITRAAADRLLAAGGVKDLKTLQELIDTEFKPASAQLDDAQVAAGKVEILQKQIPVKNVLAILPGRGWNADEYIVVGAHYDHLGFGGSGSLAGATTRSVHNGADDNASGTAAVLDLARRLAARKTPLQRSVLFMFFTGEERGLLGSEHFVNNPLVPIDKIHSMYNLDMVGRIKNNEIAVGGRETAAAFDAMMNEIDAATPLKFTRMSGITFGSSDHASFMAKKIPVLFLFSGLHSDYHRPTDDIEKVNYDGIATVVDISEEIVRSLAVMPKQKFLPTLTRRATTGPAATQGARVQLGVVPSYTEDEAGPEGIKINGTVPGTAAEAAGLKEGDVIQAINGKKMNTLEDLTALLEGAKVGDKLTLHLLRGKDSIDVEATLKPRSQD